MRSFNLLVPCLAIGLTGISALAQDAPRRGNRPEGERPAGQPGGGQPGERGGGGQRGMQLSPEKAKAAWELTATGVAKRLGLNEEQTKGVVKAYVDARTSHTAASQRCPTWWRDCVSSKTSCASPNPSPAPPRPPARPPRP